MRLAMAAHHAQQVFVGQDRRGREHGFGDSGLVIGQSADQGMGRIGRVREPGGQFGANRGLHVSRQTGQDGSVEGVFGGAAGRGSKEMPGQFTQQGAALLA